MKNQIALNEINAELQDLEPSQLRAFHQAMQWPEFPLIVLRLAKANNDQMSCILQFVSHLVR